MHKATCSCHAHSGFLTALGLRAVAQRSLEGLEVDGMAASSYLDMVGSVSANGHGHGALWPSSKDLLEQCERFHSGS